MAATTSPPFDGYDRLHEKEVVASLSDHSQAELAAVEAYERENKNRQPVLDKLRFMRQAEPFSGYDDMPPAEIATHLDQADMNTIKKVRGYERKFGNRPDVLEEVARVHGLRRETDPAATSAPYVPTQYRSAE